MNYNVFYFCGGRGGGQRGSVCLDSVAKVHLSVRCLVQRLRSFKYSSALKSYAHYQCRRKYKALVFVSHAGGEELIFRFDVARFCIQAPRRME